MLTGSGVAERQEFSVTRVRCTAAPAGFDPPEMETGHVLVAVSRGAFVRRTEGREVLVDSTTAYLSAPGTVEEFAHPVPGGDACTAIRLRPGLIASLAGGDLDLRLPSLPMDPASMFALHRITANARAGDPDGTLAEDVIRLVTALIGRKRPELTGRGRPATAAARQRIVNRARLALAAEPRLGLIALSRTAGCSPHHLSRVFADLTGSTVSEHRNRLRIGLALDRLARGEPDLARLAHDLGFADHAHLTRAVRAATGHPPSACRQLLR
ncbi:MAG: helix-turn-helix domain-containing protein [Streptosporangiaceae bacterium]